MIRLIGNGFYALAGLACAYAAYHSRSNVELALSFAMVIVVCGHCIYAQTELEGFP